MTDNLDLARQWLHKAMNDLLNVDNNLNSDTIPFDTVCYHCQQAAEKLLKAYLVGNNRDYPFSHDLLLILEKVLTVDPEAETLRNSLTILIPYAVEIRYPDDGFMPEVEDAIEARDAAGKVLDWLEKALPDLFSDSVSDSG
jgi:HEPN domain-containing protein